VKIEILTDTCWQRYRRIRLCALADTPDAFARTLAEEEAFAEADWRRRLSSGAAVFVAMRGGQDVGTATGSAWRERPGVAGLFGMWVAPAARRGGTGKALVCAVVEWARASGFEQLILDVADSNTAAIRLYQSMGFAPTGATGTLPPPRDHVTEHERSLSLGDL